MLYKGRVVSASVCDYWTNVFERKIKNNEVDLTEYLNKTRAEVLENLPLQGFSLICLIKTELGLEYVEMYTYGAALIRNGVPTYIEVIQPCRSDYGYETFELSLDDELSQVELLLEGLDHKILPNGTVRNVRGMSNTPLLKCRYSRLNRAWLESQVCEVVHTQAAPASKVEELVLSA